MIFDYRIKERDHMGLFFYAKSRKFVVFFQKTCEFNIFFVPLQPIWMQRRYARMRI